MQSMFQDACRGLEPKATPSPLEVINIHLHTKVLVKKSQQKWSLHTNCRKSLRLKLFQYRYYKLLIFSIFMKEFKLNPSIPKIGVPVIKDLPTHFSNTLRANSRLILLTPTQYMVLARRSNKFKI